VAQEPIIIIGGGPVGMTAAVILAKNGVPVKLFEKEESLPKEWRASTIHAGTLELLERTGLVDELHNQGITAEKVQYRDRKTGLFAEFDFSLIKDETKYPYRLQIPQSTFVKIFYEYLKTNPNAEVHFNTEFVKYDQDQDGVTVTLKNKDGEFTLRTPYLLGADGSHSKIRKQLGVEFPGYMLEERFYLTGTPVPFTNYLPDIGLVNYISDPEEFLFILKVPEAWRILWPIPPHVSDEEARDPETTQSKIQKALNTTDTFPIIETQLYRIHQRVASKYFDNRVVMLGDAAHLNSPMGGLGLNNGVHDAVDLSERLLRILNGAKNVEAELQKYSDVRRKVAIDYVKQITERNTSVLTEKDPVKRIQMQQEYAQEAADPVRARKWILRSAMIAAAREQGIGEAP